MPNSMHPNFEVAKDLPFHESAVFHTRVILRNEYGDHLWFMLNKA